MTGVMSSPFFIDELVSLNGSFSGATAYVSDDLGCSASLPMQNLDTHDAITEMYGMFDIDVAATDCSGGVYTVRFTDEPLYVSNIFLEPLSGYTYRLFKDGVVTASGALSTIFQTGPARLELPGLTYGQYALELNTQNGTAQSVIYCPIVHDFLFCVPKANDCQTNLRLRSALASVVGSGGLMTDGLRTAGLLPLVEPYSTLGYAYTGTTPGATISPNVLVLTGNDAIVDWVVVELRNVTTPAVIMSSRPALIQRDGDVVDLDGDPYVHFPVPHGYYKVAIRHRNHLGCMTAGNYLLNTDPCRSPIDLKANGVVTYGTQARKYMSVGGVVGGLNALWPGDVTYDGVVKYAGGSNDRDPILTLIGGTTPTNTVNNVYNGADLNLDGKVKYAGSANDRDVILQTIGGAVPTATRTQQLP